jgi:hypothetical protein
MFGTKDSSPNILKVHQSESKWTKVDLTLLGIDYQYRAHDDIQIRTEDGDMPPELLHSNNLFIAN